MDVLHDPQPRRAAERRIQRLRIHPLVGRQPPPHQRTGQGAGHRQVERGADVVEAPRDLPAEPGQPGPLGQVPLGPGQRGQAQGIGLAVDPGGGRTHPRPGLLGGQRLQAVEVEEEVAHAVPAGQSRGDLGVGGARDHERHRLDLAPALARDRREQEPRVQTTGQLEQGVGMVVQEPRDQVAHQPRGT